MAKSDSSYRYVDTHCHIHDDQYGLDAELVIEKATNEGVTKLIAVGTDAKSSQQAIDLAQKHDTIWATVGLHPHDAKSADQLPLLLPLAAQEKVVAIGECGIDYYYGYSDNESQKHAFRQQAKLSKQLDLPLVLHIRGSKDDPDDAFRDAWTVLDEVQPAKPAIVHSFTGTRAMLREILARHYYVALNGIVTFSGDPEHAAMIKQIPLEKLLLETDAPYLTPNPFRGTINEPKNVRHIAKFIAEIRHSESEAEIAGQTTRNAESVFGI